MPLSQLERDIKKVSRGKFKFKFKLLDRKDEIGQLSKWFAIMLKNLQNHIKQLAINLEEKKPGGKRISLC